MLEAEFRHWYDRLAELALAYVEKHFGYSQHAERIRAAADRPLIDSQFESVKLSTGREHKAGTKQAATAKESFNEIPFSEMEGRVLEFL